MRLDRLEASGIFEFVVIHQTVEQLIDQHIIGLRDEWLQAVPVRPHLFQSPIEFLECDSRIARPGSFALRFAAKGIANPPRFAAKVDAAVSALARIGLCYVFGSDTFSVMFVPLLRALKALADVRASARAVLL